VDDDLGGMRKDVVVAYFKILFRNLSEGNNEKNCSTASDKLEIRSPYL